MLFRQCSLVRHEDQDKSVLAPNQYFSVPLQVTRSAKLSPPVSEGELEKHGRPSESRAERRQEAFDTTQRRSSSSWTG
jgi:hypothetical protein